MKREPWQIAAARYCLENAEEGFAGFHEIKDYLTNLEYRLEDYQVQQFFEEEIQRPTGRQHNRIAFANRNSPKQKWQPPFDLVQKVIDYDEIVLARTTSQEASFYSRIAISIAFITLIVSAIMPILFTSKVEIQNKESK